MVNVCFPGPFLPAKLLLHSQPKIRDYAKMASPKPRTKMCRKSVPKDLNIEGNSRAKSCHSIPVRKLRLGLLGVNCSWQRGRQATLVNTRKQRLARARYSAHSPWRAVQCGSKEGTQCACADPKKKKRISQQTHLRFPQIRPGQPHPLLVALAAVKEVFLCFHSQLVPGNIFFLSRFLPRPIPQSVMSCFYPVSLYTCQRFICCQVFMSCGRTASN